MAVTATPATPSVVSADEIRMFLRDFALGHLTSGQGNLILDDVQFSPKELALAIKMAVSAYNLVTHVSNVTAANFPNEYLLLIGVTRFLLLSEGFHQLRNQVNAQDGDIAPAGIYEKAAAYIALSNTLNAEWTTSVRSLKNQLNMEGAYSSLGSGMGGGKTI